MPVPHLAAHIFPIIDSLTAELYFSTAFINIIKSLHPYLKLYQNTNKPLAICTGFICLTAYYGQSHLHCLCTKYCAKWWNGASAHYPHVADKQQQAFTVWDS